MKYILIATDFSDNSIAAAKYALKLFGSLDVRYTLLNTFQDPASSSTTFVSIAEQLEKESVKGLEEVKTELEKELGSEYKIQPKAIYGSLFSVINKLMDEDLYDYLVIGATGAGAIESFLVGSNTIDVLKKVKMPTIIVPPTYEFRNPDVMVFANDNQGIADGVCDPLIKLAEFKEAMLRVVHVHSAKDAGTNMESLNGIFLGVPHEFELIEDESVANGLTEYTKEVNGQMLAMVVRKYSFFEKLVHKSVTKEVSVMGACPLLLLHELN